VDKEVSTKFWMSCGTDRIHLGGGMRSRSAFIFLLLFLSVLVLKAPIERHADGAVYCNLRTTLSDIVCNLRTVVVTVFHLSRCSAKSLCNVNVTFLVSVLVNL